MVLPTPGGPERREDGALVVDGGGRPPSDAMAALGRRRARDRSDVIGSTILGLGGSDQNYVTIGSAFLELERGGKVGQ